MRRPQERNLLLTKSRPKQSWMISVRRLSSPLLGRRSLAKNISTMTNRQSYASIVSSKEKSVDPPVGSLASQPKASNRTPKGDTHCKADTNSGPVKRSTSPAHIPRTSSPEAEVYVLTFLTDPEHHDTLTALRKRYFPPRLNKLDAHLTLFHALPGSKLEELIIPVLEHAAEKTSEFRLVASRPFRMKHGIAIAVPKNHGGDLAKDIHAHLQRQWQGVLSDQDAGGFRAHYTIMNKVDNEAEIGHAMEEVEHSFTACPGMVKGLSLWLYDRGGWAWRRDFEFQKAD